MINVEIDYLDIKVWAIPPVKQPELAKIQAEEEKLYRRNSGKGPTVTTWAAV